MLHEMKREDSRVQKRKRLGWDLRRLGKWRWRKGRDGWRNGRDTVLPSVHLFFFGSLATLPAVFVTGRQAKPRYAVPRKASRPCHGSTGTGTRIVPRSTRTDSPEVQFVQCMSFGAKKQAISRRLRCKRQRSHNKPRIGSEHRSQHGRFGELQLEGFLGEIPEDLWRCFGPKSTVIHGGRLTHRFQDRFQHLFRDG